MEIQNHGDMCFFTPTHAQNLSKKLLRKSLSTPQHVSLRRLHHRQGRLNTKQVKYTSSG
jgi:hypothetical protein